jgi:hypothetical protein
MTQRDAISLMEYGFKKVAVTTEISQSEKLFHYFFLEIDGLTLFLQSDDEVNWYMFFNNSKQEHKSLIKVEKFVRALQSLK